MFEELNLFWVLFTVYPVAIFALAQLLAFPQVLPILPPTLSYTYQVHWPVRV